MKPSNEVYLKIARKLKRSPGFLKSKKLKDDPDKFLYMQDDEKIDIDLENVEEGSQDDDDDDEI